MKSSKVETNPNVLRDAMMRRVYRRTRSSGNMTLPAAPSMLDAYVELLSTQFRVIGRVFSKEEEAHLRKVLSEKLIEGWRHSPHCHIYIEWQTGEPPAVSISYTVWARLSSMKEQYEDWVNNREPPLFGSHPDCKVIDIASSLGAPAENRCLDIGAGTGRNSLPLARAGFPVDAVEAVPDLVKILKAEASRAGARVNVIEGDLFKEVTLKPQYYRFIFLSEVVSHFRDSTQLRALFDRASRALAPGGLLLFNAFVAHDSYTLAPMARELSDVFWSTAFSRKQLSDAAAGLGFEQVSDEQVYEYEKSRTPEDSWPPTGWFPDWTRGLDIFDLPAGKSPVEMRWLLYRRSA